MGERGGRAPKSADQLGPSKRTPSRIAEDYADEYDDKFGDIVTESMGVLEKSESGRAITARQINHLIVKWRNASVALTREFVQQLSAIRADAGWVRKEAEKAWPRFNAKCRFWILIACKLAFRLLSADVDPSLTKHWITSTNGQALDRAQRVALEEVARTLSSNKQSGGRNRDGIRDPIFKQIGELMARHPFWTNERILGKYDLEDGEESQRFKRHSHIEGGMLDALRCPGCKHPLESTITRVRKKLKLPARR